MTHRGPYNPLFSDNKCANSSHIYMIKLTKIMPKNPFKKIHLSTEFLNKKIKHFATININLNFTSSHSKYLSSSLNSRVKNYMEEILQSLLIALTIPSTDSLNIKKKKLQKKYKYERAANKLTTKIYSFKLFFELNTLKILKNLYLRFPNSVVTIKSLPYQKLIFENEIEFIKFYTVGD